MQNLSNFKNEELSKLTSFVGGGELKTKIEGGLGCDVHDDDNNNGEIDKGECLTIVECE